MFALDDVGFGEILELSRKALGPGLSEAERERWRARTASVLEVLRNMNPAGRDRRRHLRGAATLPVDVVSAVGVRRSVTNTVGGGGLSIPMADPPEIGVALQLSIRASQRRTPISAKAAVVWRKPPPAGEIGVMFTHIDDRDRDLLEAMIVEQVSEMRFDGY